MDPGVSGAIAVLADGGAMIEVYDLPVFKIKGKSKLDVHQLGEFMRRHQRAYGDCRAVVELVHSMPEQGVASSFSFGFGTGCLHGAIGALSMPLEVVTPQRWKKHFRLGADKDEARRAATQRWPAGGLFSRVKDEHRAEAALIALWSIETSRTSAAAEMVF